VRASFWFVKSHITRKIPKMPLCRIGRKIPNSEEECNRQKVAEIRRLGANAMKTEIIPVGEEMAGPPWSAQPWLGGATLSVLAELNEQCLSLLVEEAAAQNPASAQPLLRDLGQLWSKLDAKALKRAAACPYLLMDTGFADPQRWLWAQGQQVLERERGPTVPFFTVPRAAALMRTVLTYGWHLAQNRQSAARLLLGMSPQCVNLVRACTLIQVGEAAAALAAACAHWA
jgi:hypothetical protein